MIRFLIFFLFIATVHGQVLTSQDIAQSIKDHIQTQIRGIEDFDVILAQGKLELQGESIAIDKVTLSDNERQFEAWLQSPVAVKITGRIQPLTEVPVLTRPISPGEIVADSDLDWKKIPSNRLAPNMIRQVSDIIGKTAHTRVLQSGQPLLRSDLKAPLLVKKGDTVSVSYRVPGMSVTAVATALQDGAKGETIRFQSSSSKKEIRARILDHNRAEITPVEF